MTSLVKIKVNDTKCHWNVSTHLDLEKSACMNVCVWKGYAALNFFTCTFWRWRRTLVEDKSVQSWCWFLLWHEQEVRDSHIWKDETFLTLKKNSAISWLQGLTSSPVPVRMWRLWVVILIVKENTAVVITNGQPWRHPHSSLCGNRNAGALWSI